MGYIYCITNQINDKKYVGLTTTSLVERMSNHKANSKRHPNLPLYRAFNKYGIENFSIEVLEEVDNSMLSEREIYWIAKLDTFNSQNGYNATLGGEGGHRIYTEEDMKRIISLWESGMTISDINAETGIGIRTITTAVCDLPNFKERTQEMITERIRKARGRRVKQYSLSGELIKEYETQTDAQKELGLPTSTQIAACCQNKNRTCHGFLWRYEDDDPPQKNSLYGKRKKVDQYDADMNYIATYSTITEASQAINGSPGGISDSCRHTTWKSKGYFWRYHID